MPSQGDILLVPVPFTDLSAHKQRPVVVVSNDAYNRQTTDIVVVAMTSNPALVDYIQLRHHLERSAAGPA